MPGIYLLRHPGSRFWRAYFGDLRGDPARLVGVDLEGERSWENASDVPPGILLHRVSPGCYRVTVVPRPAAKE